jgi:uncharacterized phage protein gp47/JayE
MFAIPSLRDLVERARSQFRTNLPGSDAWIWPNNINPTAKVLGGMTHEVFGFADYIQRQKFALTADSENLDMHGAELGLARRPAAPASGLVTITDVAAMSLAVGAVLRRADGVEYIATAGGSMTGAGTVDVEVVAAIDGQATTAIAGTPLEIISGVVGSDPTAAVSTANGGQGITGGQDVEGDEPFRARILFRKRNPPHGGSAADYVMWASSVPGVSSFLDQPTVFVERLFAGPGTVRVFPLMFDLYANGIPLPADVARVQDYIETVRPAGAMVTVAAPIAHPVDVTISGLHPNTAAERSIVVTELQNAFRRLARVAGSDIDVGNMPYLAYPTSFSRSWIWQAVANATGEVRHAIDAPAADIPLVTAEMPTLGTVSFV